MYFKPKAYRGDLAGGMLLLTVLHHKREPREGEPIVCMIQQHLKQAGMVCSVVPYRNVILVYIV